MKVHIGDVVCVETVTTTIEGIITAGFDLTGWPTSTLQTEINLDDEFTVEVEGKGWRVKGWLLSNDDIEVVKSCRGE